MKIIVGGIASGKTTQLIKLSASTRHYIVTSTHKMAYQTAKMAQEMGLDIPFPMTFREFLEGKYHAPGVKGILIDDADALIQSISRVPITGITLTGDSNGHL